MKKGFTLIELLAVIVILAIIATIAVPIVLSIIEDAKESTTLRNAEYYLDAVEQSIARESLNTGSAYQPTECEIQQDGNLLCDGEVEVIVEVKGKKTSSGTITFDKGKMTNISLEIENKVVTQNENNELVIGESSGGNNSICTLKEGEPNAIGSKYQCKVKDDMEEGFEDGYYFYVVSHEEDGTTNLIMDRNMCEDGTTEASDEKCSMEWGYPAPTKAMTYLHNATKSWRNVPPLNYEFNQNEWRESLGLEARTYDLLFTSEEGVGKLNGTKFTGEELLRARMPIYAEDLDGVEYGDVSDKKDDDSNAYLYENLGGGYWLLSSFGISQPYLVRNTYIAYAMPEEPTSVRPVINLKI